MAKDDTPPATLTMDDLDKLENIKATPYGTKPERVKRQLSPEMEKAVNDTGMLSALMRATANSATFDQSDRLAAKMQGTPIEDQWEMSKRIRENNPWTSVLGDVLGMGAQTAVTGGAGLIPRLAGAGIGRVAAREAINAGGQSLADNLIKTAEGREEFSPGKVVAGAALGGAGGAVASQIPRVLGHAESIAASTKATPFTAAERADLAAGRAHGERYNFTGEAGLDLPQAARVSENPNLAQWAAQAERIKDNAGPGYAAGREAIFTDRGLDHMMAQSVPRRGVVTGPTRGGFRDFPEMSGREVGQEFRGIPRETVVNPVRPVPPDVQRAMDDAYTTRLANFHGRTAQAPNPEGAFGPTRPNPNEMKMWDDVIGMGPYQGRYPINRADREATRSILQDSGDPLLRNRMIAEQRAEDVGRIHNAVRNPPTNPTMWPDNITLGGSVGRVPFLNRIPGLGGLRVGLDIPTAAARPTARYARAAELLRDPNFAEIIGRLTQLQERMASAGRATGQEPTRSMSRKE